MTTPITSVNPQVSSTKQPQKTTKTSIFYINDVHSNITNLEKLKSASDNFDSFTPSEKVDKLKFSAGDVSLGVGIDKNKYGVIAQNAMGIMATAVGNHEFDLVKDNVAKVVDDSNFKLLGMNVNIPETIDSNKKIKSKIMNSYIQEQNGTKYGVIGLIPFDFRLHATHPQEYSDFDVYSIEKTIPLLQKEIDDMKEKGVNKIILLSHGGKDADKKLAQSVEGIDVIIGGHTHNLIKDLKEGENLFYSKKTGEPTIITQAGKDGQYFGILNLEFDESGVIKSAQNNVNETEKYTRNPIMKAITNKIFGKPNTVGKINSVEKYSNCLVEENPGANFIADTVRETLPVDIAIINPGNIRGKFEAGSITDRDISEMTPFKNEMCILPLSEKEIVDAIKVGGKSLTNKASMPGILAVSGLKYTLSKNGDVKEIFFVDKEGKETKIDVNNPNPFKTYKVAADSFIVKGGNSYLSDKRSFVEKEFDYDKDTIAIDYIKKSNKPIDIKYDGRIKIENQ